MLEGHNQINLEIKKNITGKSNLAFHICVPGVNLFVRCFTIYLDGSPTAWLTYCLNNCLRVWPKQAEFQPLSSHPSALNKGLETPLTAPTSTD